MLEEIVGALERHQGVSDWSVSRRRSRSVQLYLVGREVESQREVVTEEFDVEVFNDHDPPQGDDPSASPAGASAPPGGSAKDAGGTVRGVASVKLVPADAGRVQARLDDAVLMARLVHNPPYALAGPADYPDVPLADPALATLGGAGAAAVRFAEELWGLVDAEAGVRLSAAELFLTHVEVTLRNSRGVRAESAGTRVMSELVLLAGGAGTDEAEHFRQLESRRLTDLRLAEAVAEAARFARDTLRARAPQTRTGPVVLCGDALIPLFGAFTYQASAGAAYMKLSRFEVGQSLFDAGAPAGDAGDRLTLRANALRPFGLASHRFGSDGVPGQDTLLIEGGVLRARHAPQRYAQYLGIPPTGSPGNTEVAPGAASLERLLERGEGPVYQVVGFSAPDVDPITGDFGSEIRLGYEITLQGRHPIKGGSVSGNVFEAFAGARFASETLERGEYAGPAAVRFEALRVSGDD